jgi:hypothetical protein
MNHANTYGIENQGLTKKTQSKLKTRLRSDLKMAAVPPEEFTYALESNGQSI